MTLTTEAHQPVDGSRADARRLALLASAALMVLAAVIHLDVIPAHVQEWLPAAVFFGVLAVGQASMAVLLVRRPHPITLLVAIWSSVGVVALYVWSRTSGLPFAPVDHGEGHGAGGSHVAHAVGGHGNGEPIFPGQAAPTSAEPVGPLDLAALAAELAVIALLVLLLPAKYRRWTSNGIFVCGLAMVALRATAGLH
jgi:hypothetical protein